MSTPSTAAERAFMTACGTHSTNVPGCPPIALVSQHRSTSHCAECQARMEPVFAATPERIYAAAAARATRELPAGWARPPERMPRPYREVRGQRRCPNPACSMGLRGRDFYPSPAMEANFRSRLRGEGGVPIMQKGAAAPKVAPPLGGFHLITPLPLHTGLGAQLRAVGPREVRGSRGAGGSGSGR
jgi:hypothetical protein